MADCGVAGDSPLSALQRRTQTGHFMCSLQFPTQVLHFGVEVA
ncbi:MAG: hypothetical protein OXF03_03975 [Gammaproteobacteria bacterium]|nr:hypothetical protein [Gammaproteobacteria bacterium]MCY4255850.1 hypothetical protein [Gammaproteobacteria bacterium]